MLPFGTHPFKILYLRYSRIDTQIKWKNYLWLGIWFKIVKQNVCTLLHGLTHSEPKFSKSNRQKQEEDWEKWENSLLLSCPELKALTKILWDIAKTSLVLWLLLFIYLFLSKAPFWYFTTHHYLPSLWSSYLPTIWIIIILMDNGFFFFSQSKVHLMQDCCWMIHL